MNHITESCLRFLSDRLSLGTEVVKKKKNDELVHPVGEKRIQTYRHFISIFIMGLLYSYNFDNLKII